MPNDPNEPLTEKQKAAVSRAKKYTKPPSTDDVRMQGQKRKKKSVGYAKGGKVRGCGLARRGMGRAASTGKLL